MDDVRTLQMPSRTIFWQDLGLPKRSMMGNKMEDRLAKVWDEFVQPWILENVSHRWNAHEAGVWFADSRDAVLFKLVWAGNIDISE